MNPARVTEMGLSGRIDAALSRACARYGQSWTLSSSEHTTTFTAVCQYLGEAETAAAGATFELWDFILDQRFAERVGSFLSVYPGAIVRPEPASGFYFRPAGMNPLVELTGHAGKILKTRKYKEK